MLATSENASQKETDAEEYSSPATELLRVLDGLCQSKALFL